MATVTVTPDFLTAFGSPPDVVRTDAPLLSQFMTQFEIDTPQRVAHFFGQLAAETNNGRLFSEGGTRAVSDSGGGGRGWIQLTAGFNYKCYEAYLRRTDRPDRVAVPYRDVFRQRTALLQPLYRVHSACWYWTTGTCCHPDGSTTPAAQCNGNGNRLADRGGVSQVRVITENCVRPGIPHLARRQDGYRRSLSLIEQGMILFDGGRGDIGSATDPVLVASATRIKSLAVSKPTDALGIARLNADGSEGIAMSGVLTLGALGLAAVFLR